MKTAAPPLEHFATWPSPSTITIAITVYNRLDYVIEAIESALAQTQAVQVLVVEDCGPDARLGETVKARFGNRIRYHRNQTRRGLFGNWNACVELCQTPWLSILHDDDYLAPSFVTAMEEVGAAIPDCGIYFSNVTAVDQTGRTVAPSSALFKEGFRRLDPRSLAYVNEVLFPGQLFRVDYAKKMGGFRESSFFCGDWEMWFKLAYRFGAAQTARPVAYCRVHGGVERGTNRVVRTGRKYVSDFVQAKRNLALLRNTYPNECFDRRKTLRDWPFPTKELLQNAASMSPRLFRYNTQLVLQSRAPNWRYAVFQAALRVFGARFALLISRCMRASGRSAAWSGLAKDTAGTDG